MITAALSSHGVPPALAGKADALDAEFLDYLAACESKDDNWTVVAGDKQRRKPADKNAPKAEPPANKAAPKPEARS